MYRIRSGPLLLMIVVLCAACTSATGVPTVPPPDASRSQAVPAAPPTTAAPPTVAPAPTTAPAPTAALAAATAAPTAPAADAPAATSAPATAAGKSPAAGPYAAPPKDIPPGVLPANPPLGQAVVLAWNNLGMHCYQSDFSRFLILPPYNVFWAQVIRRGEEPRIVTQQLTAEYYVLQETKPEAHTDFWQYAAAYGWKLEPGVGLTGKKISGTMDPAGDHFIAEGVPVVDVNDQGTWDPFPFFVVSVKSGGNTVATTLNVAPASTEMSCYICHKGDTQQAVMESILGKHDDNEDTKLLDQARGGKPVLCNGCHADPAMGVMDNHNAKATLSGAMHTWHATKMKKPGVPENACQSCHPGPSTNCLRDVHVKLGITCTNCHGDMAQVGAETRTPWVNLPACQSCHTETLQKATATTIADPAQGLTANGDALFRNSKAHGGGGIYCAACHNSPHALYAATTARDNEQMVRLQGEADPLKKCEVCHMEKPDEPFWHFRGPGRD